ncbi:MAG: hypothetical protein A2096_00405 [Spirochaetes bacterium GWF1_41_5]|nr:MAG: hypothetical protein A2096_00405 [Spirochaetes bacterium GWF1_41_5]HBE01989.1 hypothetical protein [Spirochaetia bacterium]
MILENQFIKVSFDKTGSFSLSDKISGENWESDPWNEGAGIVSLYKPGEKNTSENQAVSADQGDWGVGENLSEAPKKIKYFLSNAEKIHFSKSKDNIKIQFLFKDNLIIEISFALKQNSLALDIEKCSLPKNTLLDEIQYPLRFGYNEADVKGLAVLPNQSGIILPTHKYSRIGGEWWRMDDASFVKNRWGGRLVMFDQLSMNWVGMQRETAGLQFILETPFDSAVDFQYNTNEERFDNIDGKMVMKKRITAFTPVWFSSLLDFRYARKMTIKTIGKTGINEMCSEFRKWSEEKNLVLTLKDKIKQNEKRNLLVGATHIDLYGGYPHYTEPPCKELMFDFKDVENLILRLKNELSINKLSLTVWGTFEKTPPDCWPVTKLRGGAEGWKKACETADKNNCLISAYHAYSVNLENGNTFFPERSQMIKPWSKSIFERPRWNRLCSSYYKDYVEKNLPLEVQNCGPNSDFTDILAVNGGHECYSKAHKHASAISRTENYNQKAEIYKYIHDTMNLPNSSEHGSVMLIRYVDCFNGVMRNIYNDINIMTPLLQMCFHDCVVTRAHPGLTYRNKGLNQYFEQVLLDMSFGNAPLHSMQMWEYEGRKKDLVNIHKVLGRLHEKTGLLKLSSYEFLDNKFLVRKTTFEDGTKVFVNLSLDEYIGEVKLDQYGYKILFSDGEDLSGKIITDLVVDKKNKKMKLQKKI